MNGKIKTSLIAGGAGILGLVIGAAGASGGSSAATASGMSTSTVTVTATAAAEPAAAQTVTMTQTVPGPTVTETAQPAAAAAASGSTCDAVREAILTGSDAQIKAAMSALQNDKSADPNAREYAQNYLVRDAGSKDLRTMDVSIIQSSCALSN